MKMTGLTASTSPCGMGSYSQRSSSQTTPTPPWSLEARHPHIPGACPIANRHSRGVADTGNNKNRDIKTWMLLIVIYGSTGSGTITNFFPRYVFDPPLSFFLFFLSWTAPTKSPSFSVDDRNELTDPCDCLVSVVEGLGYDSVTTLLLTAPAYVVAVIASVTNAWHADKTGERFLHIALPPLLAMAMYIVAAATTAFGPRYLFVSPLVLLRLGVCGVILTRVVIVRFC